AINRHDIAQLLLDRGAQVNARDNAGNTALFYAAYRQTSAGPIPTTELARLLLDHRADPNARDKSGHTPLMVARIVGLARLLVDRGADVNARDSNGVT